MKNVLALAAAALAILAVVAIAAVPTLKTTELGSGPVLVVVHDLGGGRLNWLPAARKLVGAHKVVLVDLPGHGDSPAPDPFSLESAAGALDGVLARFPAESTIVVGQGMGGMLAALALEKNPARARGLVLVDVGLKFPMPIADQQRTMFLRWMDENFDAFMKQVYGSRGRDSTQNKELYAQASLVPSGVMKNYFRSLLAADAGDALAKYSRPVLYVGSEKGWPADKTWASLAKERGFEGLSAAVDTARIEGTGPWIAKERPDTVASLIAAFTKKALAAK
jgi:pimeloyl-ACP methyl ester carboxylesterase